MRKILIICFFSMFITSIYADKHNFLDEKVVLFPVRKAELASLLNSTIKIFKFKVGEKFKKGDELVLLDDRLYKQRYIKARAEILRKQETFKYADKVYKYNITLFEKKAVGEQEVEESRLRMINALSEREQAKANFDIADINLSSCKIIAPFSGRIIRKIENEYDYVREGQAILEVAEDNKLLAVMHLPSNKMINISPGMQLKFKIDETCSEVSAEVYTVSGAVNPGSRTFELRALINNENEKLRVGMSGLLISKI